MSNNQNLQGTQVIAKIFGVSVRRIEQLTAEGVIVAAQTRPRKYDLLPTIQAYIKYLSDKANGREKKETDAELETAKLQAENRIKTAKAEMAEMELKELQGELHRAEDVEAIVTDHVMLVRSMLMAMPGKLAVDLAAIDNAPEAAERVKQEVHTVLNGLANYRYDPDEYKKRVRQRRGWDNGQQGGNGDE